MAAAAGVAVLSVAAIVAGCGKDGAARSAVASPSWPKPAAKLQRIKNFGPDPTGLQMYLYVPRKVRSRPAVVVAMHYCTGSGPAMFARTEFASLADRYGFIVVYPSAPRAGHCFDISSLAATTHDQASYADPGVIVTMVRWTERHLSADPHEVFATGISSGAEMTNVLLGDYPDVFRAGSVMSGVALGCFGTVAGPEACVRGTVSMTPQQWGDMAREADQGYHGPRPRVQLWHGTADTTLYYPNFRDEVEQWSNVLGAAPERTDHPKPTWTHTEYANKSGQVVVDAYSVKGATHQLGLYFPDWAKYAIQFFGLTRAP